MERGPEINEQLVLFDAVPYIGKIALNEIDYDEVITAYGELADPRSIAVGDDW